VNELDYWKWMILIIEDEWWKLSIRFIEGEWWKLFIRFIEGEWFWSLKNDKIDDKIYWRWIWMIQIIEDE